MLSMLPYWSDLTGPSSAIVVVTATPTLDREDPIKLVLRSAKRSEEGSAIPLANALTASDSAG